MNVFYNNTGNETCFKAEATEEGSDTSSKGWYWQGCTEMLQPAIRNNSSSIFPYTYKHKASDMGCSKFFGIKPRTNWITTEFGGYVSLL